MLVIVLAATPAAVNNFPVKSKGTLPAVSYYTAHTGYQVELEDAHAVVATATADGGVVVAGKAVECGDACTGGKSATKTEAFAVKLDSAGAYAWGWRSNINGDDAANGVVALPGSGDLLVAGFRSVGGVYKRSITKLRASDGAELWTFTDFGDTTNHGAWEFASLAGTSDVLLAGFYKRTTTEEFWFKSYGNPFHAGNEAIVMKMSVASLAGASAPSASDVSTFFASSAYHTAKEAIVMPVTGDVAIQLWSEDDGKGAALAMVDSSGATTRWGPTPYTALGAFEGTSIAAAPDGSAVVIAGHGDGEVAGPQDAYGYGRFPGQYGMALLSRYPILEDQARTFQTLKWSAMPGALRPRGYYPDDVWRHLRLSSKSHWDVPIGVGMREDGFVVHALCSHPTPPAFDGEEDRNGCRYNGA